MFTIFRPPAQDNAEVKIYDGKEKEEKENHEKEHHRTMYLYASDSYCNSRSQLQD